VPLSEPSDFRVDVDVGRDRVARRRIRLVPPRRWTLYVVNAIHTDHGYTDLAEPALEIHRRNLDWALARLARQPDFRWSPECTLQVLSYLENRGPDAGGALVEAIRSGRIGFPALFANLLAGLLDHETCARVAWPAALLARERGLVYASAQIADVPGQPATFPLVLAASGVRYLVSAVNPERALPLLSSADAAGAGLRGEWVGYPQLYWWEGPDGSRVLHWRAYQHGDGSRFGFSLGPDEMARRLSDWLLTDPVLLSPAWPYDVALLYGLDSRSNAPVDEAVAAGVEEFARRYAFPRLVPARPEDFFRDLERRYTAQIPVRRGDTGLYREDGAASTAAELALFRRAQLAARAADLLALWEERLEPPDDRGADRIRRRAEERRALWRDLLLFGEHTWGAAGSVTEPDARQTVAQWAYKRRTLEVAWATACRAVADSLVRIGERAAPGPGRLVFNASTWDRTEVAVIPGGAGRALFRNGRELPTVDLPDGASLALIPEVPGLGYLALTERPREARPAVDEGAGLEAAAGGFQVRLDEATGAIASLVGPDGKERVRPSPWSGLNQLVYVRGGERSALWTGWDRKDLGRAPTLAVAQAGRVASRRERLPGIGVRLIAERRVSERLAAVSTVTLYDELPWLDIENRITKTATLEKEAVYVAFPFAFVKPTVDVEVPLGRMRVERDQQPGSCRDWYCQVHWVWLTEGADGVVWSAPDTPLFTLNDLFRGEWRRRIEPDGTIFAYVMHNYWYTNFAARQGGEAIARFRISLLGPGAPAEPVRRGWAACDPLYVSEAFTASGAGPFLERDRALFLADGGVLVVAAKPADDGEGTIVRLLDVSGADRAVAVWPAAVRFQAARRTDFVERNEAPLPLAEDGRAAVAVRAWGAASLRLFTPRAGAG
ncbi:MAG TPA: hypothetical protein VNI61_11365, partial [Gemmatimonadales bacterium]|nr:hypothetical protein [Gemmatimonadales bacterium]